jgi:hypothetical protein
LLHGGETKLCASNRLMHRNMIADFFSALRLIFKHKPKDRFAAVFLFPSCRQFIKVGIGTPTEANLGDSETWAGVRAA